MKLLEICKTVYFGGSNNESDVSEDFRMRVFLVLSDNAVDNVL